MHFRSDENRDGEAQRSGLRQSIADAAARKTDAGLLSLAKPHAILSWKPFPLFFEPDASEVSPFLLSKDCVDCFKRRRFQVGPASRCRDNALSPRVGIAIT